MIFSTVFAFDLFVAAGGQEAGVPPCQAHTGGDTGGGRVWAGGAGQGPRPHGERLHQGGRQDAQVSLLGIRAPGRVNILATNHQERKCKIENTTQKLSQRIAILFDILT